MDTIHDGTATLADYARRARARMDAATWDFIAGGAGEERTLAANLAAFEHLRLRPGGAADSSRPVTATQILGRTWPVPLAIAPMAYHTLADVEGEVATARGAARVGAVLVVSTFAGRTFEDIASAAASPVWLQVYCFRDRGATRRVIERAALAGFEALVLTVDTPQLGRRLRDVRNDFRLPPDLKPVNLDGADFSSPSDHALAEFDPGLDWSVVDWLHSVSPLPVLLKGILTEADARRAVEAGADGIVVSNHGGRQLDGVPATFEVLPEIASAAAGRCPILVDGGVRRGSDVLACLAMGADAALLGRPILHGLAVQQEEGVSRVLTRVADELVDAMRHTGIHSVAGASPALIQVEPG